LIQTQISTELNATLIHRVTGELDLLQAEQATAEALALAQQLLFNATSIHLLLDLRGMRFLGLQARRVWTEGFVRHPLLLHHTKYVALIADDLPAARAEQEVMETEQFQFFYDLDAGKEWLANKIHSDQATDKQA
jgi:hypothetical protein